MAKPKAQRYSQARADAARENGKRGGRPRKDRVGEDFADIGPPPLGDPLRVAAWVQEVNAIDLTRIIGGRGDAKISAEIRATSRVILSSVPLERIHDAEGVIAGHADRRKGAQKPVELTDVEESAAPISGRPPGR